MAVNQDNPEMQADRDPQLSGLYRAAATQDPPQRLDAAIQAAARRAVGARPRPADASFLRAWRVPVSIAAVLVLSVSMVTLTVRQKSEQAAGERLMEPALTASAPVLRTDPAPRAADVPSAPSGAQNQHDAPSAPRAADRNAAAARPKMAEAVPSAAPPTAPAPGYAASSGPGVLAERRMAPVTEEDTVSTQAARKPASSAAPGSTQQMARSQAQFSHSEGLADSAKTSDAPGVAEWIRAYDKEQPGKWLEKIQMLHREGRTAEAGEMLAEFRKRFPGHPLPTDLR
jgi:resuscitation-promoting factor RpfA